LSASLDELGVACRDLTAVHADEAELVSGFTTLARLADQALDRLRPFVEKYPAPAPAEPRALRKAVLPNSRPGSFGALQDLQGVTLLAASAYGGNTGVSQAAQGMRDSELMAACGFADEQIRRTQAWLHTQILHRAAHTLCVPN